MCLAIPGKVLHIDTTAQPVMGTVSFGGVQKSVCLDWIPELKVGEYVIVHVGFAISKMNEKEIKAVKDEWLAEWMPHLTSNDTPISPYRLIQEFRQYSHLLTEFSPC